MTKGFKRNGKFIPITDYNKNGTRKSRDKSTKTQGVRLKRAEKWDGRTEFRDGNVYHIGSTGVDIHHPEREWCMLCNNTQKRMKRELNVEEEALIVKRLHDRDLNTEKVTEEDEFGESVTFLNVNISKEQTLDAINGNRNAEEVVDHITGMNQDERLRNNISINNGLYKLELEGKIKVKNGKWVKV